MPELIRERRVAREAAMRGFSVGREVRRGLYQERLRDALVRELSSGQRIRRDFYYVEASSLSSRSGRPQMQDPGKENIPPKSVARRGQTRKSPLPDWYPRTPLREITTLLGEMERRRACLRSAARKRGNQHAEFSPSALTVTPFPQKQRSPLNALDAVFTKTPSTCFPAMKDSPGTPFVVCSMNSVQDEKKLLDRELILEKSIDVFEKLVREGLKRKPNVKSKKLTNQKTLMSLR